MRDWSLGRLQRSSHVLSIESVSIGYMADRRFLKEVEDACDAALVDLGFERPRRGTRFLEIQPHFLGWVGLNQGNHGDLVRINPNIGIHCVEVERLKRVLISDKAKPYKKGEYATFALPLGTQTPEDIDAIEFLVGAPVHNEARRLSMLIGTYGVPWMVENASYDTLIPLLEERFSQLPNYPERLAGMYYFAGRFEQAIEFTNEVLARFRERPSPTLLNQFERFASPFLKMLSEETGRSE